LSSNIRSIPRSSLARPQSRPSNLSFAPAASPATSNWYSTEPETKQTERDAAAEAKTDAKREEAENPVRKELEAKNREIIDLKVLRHSTSTSISTFSNVGINRIDTSVQ
jgi:molecular chaperone GrpE